MDRLLELSSLVRSLTIQQSAVVRVPRYENRRFILGAENIDWTKYDYLMWAYPHFLDSKGTDELKEKLPLLDKPIWFMADFGGEAQNERYEINGNIVQ
uniref:Uncharacterized protein n=1 Tax=Pristionchus pacificus TaxID=54126 RepID=A0A2A6BVK3_PRIPA